VLARLFLSSEGGRGQKGAHTWACIALGFAKAVFAVRSFLEERETSTQSRGFALLFEAIWRYAVLHLYYIPCEFENHSASHLCAAPQKPHESEWNTALIHRVRDRFPG
jgi:hypothetical protein